jgi:hypothetical protein
MLQRAAVVMSVVVVVPAVKAEAMAVAVPAAVAVPGCGTLHGIETQRWGTWQP